MPVFSFLGAAGLWHLVNSSFCLKNTEIRTQELPDEYLSNSYCTQRFPKVKKSLLRSDSIQTSNFFFGSTGTWTQGLHLEPLHRPFFLKFFFLRDKVSQTICPGWLQTVWLQTTILLVSATWAARIIGTSHQGPASHQTFKSILN
jgi:hypothetical protein